VCNSLAFLICMCFTINYTMMKLPKFSPLMKKKVILAPDQHNPLDLCFRISTLRKSYSLIYVEFAHRGPTVVPHWQGTFKISFYRSPPMIRLDDSNKFNPLLLSRCAIAPNNIRVAAVAALHTTSGQFRK
jgi:hypothetical protein